MMGGHMSHTSHMSTVRCERDGAVTIVTIDRPAVRNAVDGPTAAALADAFRRFDADDSSPVAVLTGAGGASSPPPHLHGLSRGPGPPTPPRRRPCCGGPAGRSAPAPT